MTESNDDPRTKEQAVAQESRLKRWSQRKAQARTQALATSESAATAPQPAPARAPAEAETQKAELTDEDMPPIESLHASSDLSVFFSPKVSAGLRRLALRRVFHLPVYNIRDGLNDYDDDYTNFEPLGDTVTSDMRHMLEVEERRRQERLAAQQTETERHAFDASDEQGLDEQESLERRDDRNAEPGGDESELAEQKNDPESDRDDGDVDDQASGRDAKNGLA